MTRFLPIAVLLVVLLPSVAHATVPHPTVVPVPTVISTVAPPVVTHGGALTVSPDTVTLSGDNNTSITVIGTGLPPHKQLEIDLACQSCSSSDGSNLPAPISGASPTTDGHGGMSWHGDLYQNIKAGTYLVEATNPANGDVLARAALTVQAPVDGGAFAGAWSNIVQAVTTWWAGLMQEGKDGVLSQVLGVVLYGDDPTTHTVPAVVGLMATLAAIGQGAIEVLVSVRVLTIALGLLKRAQGWGPWLTLILELTGVLVAVAALTPIEHAVWGWVQRFVTGTDTGALDPLVAAVKKATVIDTTHVADTLAGLGAIVLLVVLAAVFLIIELTRLGGFALLEVLYILGPLVVPLLLLTETRGVALTWLRSILAITVWPILYLLFIEGGVAIVFSFSGGDAAVFGNPLVKVGLGVMLVMALLMVPEMAGRLMSHLVAGAGSIVDARRTPALHIAGRAQARLRGLLPF